MRAELTIRAAARESTTRRLHLRRRWLVTPLATLGLLAAGARDGHAQSATTSKPMPNVLLLVDTSGSMERMPNNSLPSENKGPETGLSNVCSAGTESNPNRWGMLLQALTGNMQPYFSCEAMPRTSAAFRNEYKINGILPYDADYALPYHRPLSGVRNGTDTSGVCMIGPRRLPGADDGSQGVGPGLRGYSTAAGLGGDVTDYPDDALQSANWKYTGDQYSTGQALAMPLGGNECLFAQAPDGQLDAARDYVRFALMTFDNDTGEEMGLASETWPPGGKIKPAAPFLGQWSYRRDATNDYSSQPFNFSGASRGRPDACLDPTLQPFEVGARHSGAPPWEGRMIPFPPPDAGLLDIQRTNEQIQRTLLATRPYGATPIEGMMDDARDYFWFNAAGPKVDPYVATGGCRDEYIVLLTDGAPNLNMRKQCETGTGICPFKNTAAATAAELFANTTRRVTTYVIGFSVNGSSTVTGDGFPATITDDKEKNCKAWYTKVGSTPTAMAAACTATPPAAGTTAEACCALNEIAYAGSGGAAVTDAVGPFFAESQADIVLSFGKILAQITKTVSTRTTPTYTPAAYNSAAFGSGATTAQYLASYIPNAQKPWSGEITRERSRCEGTPLLPKVQDVNLDSGDSMATNLANQGAANRLFITAVPDEYTVTTPAAGTFVDAQRVVRPYYATTTLHPADGIPAYSATEVGKPDWEIKDTPSTNDVKFRRALDVDKTTCKRGKAINPSSTSNGTKPVPALSKDDGQACTDVIMGFVTAHAGKIERTGVADGADVTYDFNVRCTGSATGGDSSAGKGTCSITNGTCTLTDANPCPKAGEVCVPLCSALGAVFRANPAISGAPDGVLRDDGYRAFQQQRAKRKATMYAATTDGILHAFKATEEAISAHHELWSFIPPAVLPRLASNYPSGNQILLDGTPVVKDTIWERGGADVNSSSAGSFWHTTLVAGLGVEGGGYYAVNVTDSDCGKSETTTTTGECKTGYESITIQGNLDQAGKAAYGTAGSGAKRGPHFLWQLTDVPGAGSAERGKVARKAKDGSDRYALFGRQTGTPAITTVAIKDGSTERQVGVAILPGGIDGQPLRGLTCPRVATEAQIVSDVKPRDTVRRWATNCTGAESAVPGRSLTVVRLDNGHIIRHFARTSDVPAVVSTSVITESPFDSPVVGTPVVYPQTVGAIAQKAFVGDADGTLWRLDLSSNDPTKWKVELFSDLIAFRNSSGDLTSSAEDSQPIQVAPVISLDAGGALIINVATGDQESISYKSGATNYVYSLREVRPVNGATVSKSQVNWYQALTDGHRVTGPMTVFDRTLYFASFEPRNPTSTGACSNAGNARLWGVDYLLPRTSALSSGGAARWCTDVSASGACNVSASTPLEQNVVSTEAAGSVISGVTLKPTQSCAVIDASTGEAGGTGFSSITPVEYHLSFGIAKGRPASASAPPSATLSSIKRPLPRVATTVNAWALVVD